MNVFVITPPYLPLPVIFTVALPTYEVIKIEGEAHCQTFTVECTVKNVPNIDRTFIAKGSSRRKAEQAAAEQILKTLEIK